jgi:hypothetical protein
MRIATAGVHTGVAMTAVPDQILLLYPFYVSEETATRNKSDMF